MIFSLGCQVPLENMALKRVHKHSSYCRLWYTSHLPMEGIIICLSRFLDSYATKLSVVSVPRESILLFVFRRSIGDKCKNSDIYIKILKFLFQALDEIYLVEWAMFFTFPCLDGNL